MLQKRWSQSWIDDGFSRKTKFKIILPGEKVNWPKQDWHAKLMAISSEVNEPTCKIKALDAKLLGERVLFVLDAIGCGIGSGERK